jgi:hypothetical protein
LCDGWSLRSHPFLHVVLRVLVVRTHYSRSHGQSLHDHVANLPVCCSHDGCMLPVVCCLPLCLAWFEFTVAAGHGRHEAMLQHTLLRRLRVGEAQIMHTCLEVVLCFMLLRSYDWCLTRGSMAPLSLVIMLTPESPCRCIECCRHRVFSHFHDVYSGAVIFHPVCC